jgi:hypothetical protein
VFGDLFRLVVHTSGAAGVSENKMSWSRFVCKGGPKARSAHQAVLTTTKSKSTGHIRDVEGGGGSRTEKEYNLYVFGGEYTSPTQTRFQHYADTWCLTLPAGSCEVGGGGGGGKSARWSQLCLEGKTEACAPSPRSGHRAVLAEHGGREYMVVFGGFFDNGREVRYYDDLHVLDIYNTKWHRFARPTRDAASGGGGGELGGGWPAPRSACGLVVLGETQVYICICIYVHIYTYYIDR